MYLILDTLVLLVIVVVVCPPKALRAVARGLAQTYRQLTLAGIALSVLVGAIGPTDIALGGILLSVVVGLAGWGLATLRSGPSPSAVRTGLIALAAASTAKFVLIFPAVVPDGRSPWSFLSLMNASLERYAAPAMTQLGLDDVYPQVIAYLSEPFLWLGRHMVGFYFIVSIALAQLLYHLLRHRLPVSTEPPAIFLRPMNRLASVLTSALVIWTLTRTDARVGLVCYSVYAATAAFALVRGYAILALGITPRRLGSLLMLLVVMVTLLHPPLLVVPIGLALTEWIYPYAQWLDPDGGHGARMGRRHQGRLSAVAGQGPLVLIVGLFLIPFLLPQALLNASIPVQDAPARAAINAGQERPWGSSMVSFLFPGTAPFDMDVAEYPNVLLEPPETGHTPNEALELCAERGKHLCTSFEWFLACSDGGLHAQMPIYGQPPPPPSATGDGAAWHQVLDACNLRSTLFADTTVAPAGEFDTCRAPGGAYDLVGNVWEWVAPPAGERTWLLAGSFHGFRDSLATKCSHRVRVYPEQLPLLDLSNVGFRCCY